MVSAIRRPRVQCHRSETKATAHDQTTPITAAPRPYSDVRATSTNVPMPLWEVPIFSKQHVVSTDEIAHSGYLQSEPRAAVASAGSPSTACASGTEEDSSDSPSASLILTAPVYREVDRRLEEQSPAASVTEQPQVHTPKDDSSFNWLTQVLVKLFAGRRRSKSMSSTNARHASYASTNISNTATTDQEEPNAHLYAEDGCAPTSASTVPSPKLTHRQVIPTVTRPQRKDPSHAPIYKDEPCAPENRYTGYGVTAEDKFTPVTVQRGFNAPSSISALGALPNRRTQSASNLLDREGDVWARWHTKYPTPESHPFISSPPVAA
jgi:hypothetical protein